MTMLRVRAKLVARMSERDGHGNQRAIAQPMQFATPTEVAVKPGSGPNPVIVPARTAHSVKNGQGLAVTCLRGTVWITQERDPRDIMLRVGEWFLLDRPGRTVVIALADAEIMVDALPQARADAGACVAPRTADA